MPPMASFALTVRVLAPTVSAVRGTVASHWLPVPNVRLVSAVSTVAWTETSAYADVISAVTGAESLKAAPALGATIATLGAAADAAAQRTTAKDCTTDVERISMATKLRPEAGGFNG